MSATASSDLTTQANLPIAVVDDVPTAHADSDSVQAGAGTPATSVTGVHAYAVPAADTLGADGFGSISWQGAVAGTISTALGTLTVNANGGYSYQEIGRASYRERVHNTMADGEVKTTRTTLSTNVSNGQ